MFNQLFRKIPYDVYPIVALVSGALTGAGVFSSRKICVDKTVSTKARDNHMTGMYNISRHRSNSI